MTHFLQSLMDQYGYYVLGIALFLELLALPLPGEVLMTYAGLMVYQGHYNWLLSIVIAGVGTSIGMTLSYGIGRKLGIRFFEKHGHKIHFGPDKLKKTSLWFERFGVKLIVIAYFIPGVRHFTGYFSGITRMPFRTYALYAYTGAFIWTTTFISLGKIIGPQWEQYHKTISKYLVTAGISLAIIFAVYFVCKKYRKILYFTIASWVEKLVQSFHSLRKVRFLLLFSFGVFFTLFIIMANFIQEFLTNDLTEFDNVISFIVHEQFDDSWTVWMTLVSYLSSYQLLCAIAIATFVWIMIQGKARLLETAFLLTVLIGGALLEEVLVEFFYRVGTNRIFESFPSEQMLMTITFFGCASFLAVRHIHINWARTVAFLVVVGVGVLVGTSRIYFDIQFPSDILAGAVFGGIWVSLNVVLLEVFRFMKGEPA